MAYYSFGIKKGNIELEIRSDDKYFVGSQLEKSYSKTTAKKSKKKIKKPEISKETEEVFEAKKTPEKTEEIIEKKVQEEDLTPKQDDIKAAPKVEAAVKLEVKEEPPKTENEILEPKQDEIKTIVEDKTAVKPEIEEISDKNKPEQSEVEEIYEVKIAVEPETKEEEQPEELPDKEEIQAESLNELESTNNELNNDDSTPEIANSEPEEDQSEKIIEEPVGLKDFKKTDTEEKPAEPIEEPKAAPKRKSFIKPSVAAKPESEPKEIEIEKPDFKDDINEEVEKFLNTKNPEEKKDFQDLMQEKLNESEENITADIEIEPQEIDLPEEQPEIQEESSQEPELESEEDQEEKELTKALHESFAEDDDEDADFSEDSEPEPKKKSKVYDILEEKLSSLPDEVKNRLNINKNNEEEEQSQNTFLKFSDIDDLIYLKKPQTKLDYLLITAYYLQEKEYTDKYSLKKINSIAIAVLKEPIDHSVIHEAVAHNYFTVVPDYTGIADITEYSITKEGVDYILNEL